MPDTANKVQTRISAEFADIMTDPFSSRIIKFRFSRNSSIILWREPSRKHLISSSYSSEELPILMIFTSLANATSL